MVFYCEFDDQIVFIYYRDGEVKQEFDLNLEKKEFFRIMKKS